jgi:hypothetical protein
MNPGIKNSKKFWFIISLTIIISFSNVNNLKACWNNGGEITYTNVGQDSFAVKITLYTYCSAFNPQSFNLTYKCKTTNQILGSVNIPRSSLVDVTPVCDYTQSYCQNPNSSFIYGFLKSEYITIIDLSNTSCCEIIFFTRNTYRDCVSSNYETNAGFYYEAYLNRCIAPANSSPQFTNNPVLITQRDIPYVSNPGVVENDTNGSGSRVDSIVYELARPINYNMTPLQYDSGYSYLKPLTYLGFPNDNLQYPRGLHLNRKSGDLMFIPVRNEVTVMAIKVKEYRNGQLIGEVTRDFVLYVVNESTTQQAPIINGVFEYHLCAGDSININISPTDKNQQDTLSVSYSHNIGNSQMLLDQSNIKRPELNFSWRTAPNDYHSLPYEILVNVKDNSCPMVSLYQRKYLIYVHPKPTATISDSLLSCGKAIFKTNTESGFNPTYSWEINNQKVSITDSFIYQFNDPGNYNYSMEIANSYGCKNTYTNSLTINPFVNVKLPNDTIICEGESINIQSAVSNANGNATYSWNNSQSVTDTANFENLFSDNIIIVNISDQANCTDADTMRVKVDNFNLDITQLDTLCKGGHTTLQASPQFDINKNIQSYSWKLSGDPYILGTNDSFLTPWSHTYICEATNMLNCIARDSITPVFKPNPTISFSSNNEFCQSEDQLNLNDLASPKGGLWSSSTLQINNDTNVSLRNPGNYFLNYYYFDKTTGCSSLDSMAIDVLSLPIVNAGIDDSFCADGKIVSLAGIPTGGNWLGLGVYENNNVYEFLTDSIEVDQKEEIELIYTYTDQKGCKNIDTAIYMLFEKVNIEIADLEDVCHNASLVLLTANPDGGEWSGTGVNGTILIL